MNSIKMYWFRVKINGRICNYYSESARLDKALSDLSCFALDCLCDDEQPLEVCSVYYTYRVYDGTGSFSRRYSIRRKVKSILRLVHSSEFGSDIVESLAFNDFIHYARSYNGHFV